MSGRQWSNTQPPRGPNPSVNYTPRAPGVYKHASDSEEDPTGNDTYIREPRRSDRSRDIDRRDANWTSTDSRYAAPKYASSYSSTRQATASLEDRIGTKHDPLRGLSDTGRQFLTYNTEEPSSIAFCAKFLELNRDLVNESVTDWRDRARNAVRGAKPDLARQLLHQAELIKLFKEPDPVWIDDLIQLEPTAYQWFIRQIWSRYKKYFNQAIDDELFKTRETYMLRPWAKCVKAGLNENILPSSSASQPTQTLPTPRSLARENPRPEYDGRQRTSARDLRRDLEESDTDDRQPVAPSNPRDSGYTTRTSAIPIRSRNDLLAQVAELEDSSPRDTYRRPEDPRSRREREPVYDKPEKDTQTSTRLPRYERPEKDTIPVSSSKIVYSKTLRDPRQISARTYEEKGQPRYASTNPRQQTVDTSKKVRSDSKVYMTEDDDDDDDDDQRRRRPAARDLPEDEDDQRARRRAAARKIADEEDDDDDDDIDNEPEVEEQPARAKIPTNYRIAKKGPSGPEAEPRTPKDVPMNAILRLSGLMREFVSIDERDNKACRDFTIEYPEIWREDPKSLLAAAEECFRQGREDYARKMIERYMMLISAHENGDAVKYKVDQMKRLYKSTADQTTLRKNCAKIFANMQARSASTTTSSSSNNKPPLGSVSSTTRPPPSSERESGNVVTASTRKDSRRG